MAYVSTYLPRKCSGPSDLEFCPNTAQVVVKNRYNQDVNWFCNKHRKRAEEIAAALTETE